MHSKPTMNDTRGQLLRQFDALSPTLKLAARFMIDNPSDVIILSMRSLAARAQVQPATLVRLAQQLGFDGYPALKASFVSDFGFDGDGYGERARRLIRRPDRASLAAQMFFAQQQNLRATEAQTAELLPKAVQILKQANIVHVAGFRASFPIAYAFLYGYRLFRNTVQIVDGSSGGIEMQIRAIHENDAVAVISFAPYSKEAIALAKAVKRKRAKLLAITESAASPLALTADVTLLFSAASPSFFPSVAAGIGLVETLTELLLVDGGRAAARQVERAEASLQESGAYHPLVTRRRNIASR